MTPPEVQPSPQRIALVVLGMHRSGTSALTRVLSLLGAALPEHLLGPHSSNEAGHWEPERLIPLHDQMLAEAGSRWDDWRKLDLAGLGPDRLAHYKNEIRELILAEYGDAPILALKDPRICRMVPLYEEILDELAIRPNYVHIFRNPLAVIASLARRNQMTEGFASLMWLRHELDAEASTRDRPRAYATYEGLLGDWRRTVDRVGGALEIAWPCDIEEAADEIVAHLSRDLQHHAPTPADLKANERLAGWVEQTYGALQALAERPRKRSAALATLDRVRSEFEAVTPIFGRATFPEMAARERQLEENREQLVAAMQAREAEITSISTDKAALDSQVTELRARTGALGNQVTELGAQIEARDNQVTDLRTENATLTGQLAVLRDELAETLRSIERSGVEIGRLREANEALDNRATELRTENATLTGQLAALRDELAESRRSIEQSGVEIGRLREANEALDSRIRDLAAEKEARERKLLAAEEEAVARGAALQAITEERDELGAQLAAFRQELATTWERVAMAEDSTTEGAPPAQRSLWGWLQSLRQRRMDPSLADATPAVSDTETRPADTSRRARVAFDAVYYLDRYPDVREEGVDPFEHYMRFGWSEGRDPTPWFSTSYYLEHSPDVQAAGVNPFLHWVLHGIHEQRIATPSAREPESRPEPPDPVSELEALSAEELELLREKFDDDYYLAQYPNVAEEGSDPFEHYMRIGWREGRDPSSWFSTRYYLEHCPDVQVAGVNPLVHWLIHGIREQRPAALELARAEQSAGVDEPPVAAFDAAEIENLALPASAEPLVSVVIPVYGELAYTARCLRSIARHPPSVPIEVIVVDDDSPDETAAMLAAVPGLRLLQNDTNLGFVGSCNRGAVESRGRLLFFLNNDTEVTPDWCDELVRTFEEVVDAGVVGSKLVYPDGRLQEAGGLIWEDGSGWNCGRLEDPEHPRYNFLRDVDYVSGAALMIERRLFLDSGSFDEDLQPAYYEDTSKCFEIRELGRRVLYQPRSVIVHHEGVSNGTNTTTGVKRFQVRNQRRFVEKHGEALQSHLPNGTDPLRASDRRPIGHVLILDAVTPTPDQDSGSLDMLNLIRILNAENYRVHFVPFTNFAHAGRYTEDLQRVGVECIYAPHYPDLRQFLEERGDMFDVVLLSRLQVAAECLGTVRGLLPRAATIFYTVDLHFLRETREAELSGDREAIARSERCRTRELSSIEQADITVVLSEHERRLLEGLGHRNIRVLPLIRSIPGRDAGGFANREHVAFIGGYQHPPNVDAVRWLTGEIWPEVRRACAARGLPPIKLKLVGSRMPQWFGELAADDIEVLGFVPDLADLFGRLRLTVAPLRYGAGLKGKVATSHGFGVPVVGTSIAFEGMPVSGLDEIRVCADDPEELAMRIVDLYTDGEVWETISEAAVDYVRSHFAVEAIRPRVLDILAEARSMSARSTGDVEAVSALRARSV